MPHLWARSLSSQTRPSSVRQQALRKGFYPITDAAEGVLPTTEPVTSTDTANSNAVNVEPLGSILDSATSTTITVETPGAKKTLADSVVGLVDSNDAGETEGTNMNIINKRTDVAHSPFIGTSPTHAQPEVTSVVHSASDPCSDRNSSTPLMATLTATIPADPVLVSVPATPGLVFPATLHLVSDPPSGHLSSAASAEKVSQKMNAGNRKSTKMRPNSSLTARYASSHRFIAVMY